MKNIVEEYIPFEHKNLDYINGSLNLARAQKQNETLEGLMASAVIYTNLVEYLASNLLENLHHMISLLSYHEFNGVFFIKSRNKNKPRAPETLGRLCNLLSDYEFPDSTDFLSLIHKFAEARNAAFHRLLTVSQEELNEGVVDQQFSNLHNLAEEILDRYNVITKGITTTWYTVITPQQRQEASTRDELDSQISALLGQIAALQTQLAGFDEQSNRDTKEQKNDLNEMRLIKKYITPILVIGFISFLIGDEFVNSPYGFWGDVGGGFIILLVITIIWGLGYEMGKSDGISSERFIHRERKIIDPNED